MLDQLSNAARNAGWQVLYLSRSHPFTIRIFRENEHYDLRVYIWNITHGGKGRAADEYRIQITGFERLEALPNATTLLLGFWDAVGVFAGFDIRKHEGLVAASPSLQIRENNLRQALHTGVSPYNRGNGEIAVAFGPAFLIHYIRFWQQLHDTGMVPRDLDVFTELSADPAAVNDADLDTVTQPRRTALRSVQQALRDISFRTRVLAAYRNRCAMCGLQLDLLEAAHIVPVAVPGSTDDTYNGMALCCLHHSAYDRALVDVADDYAVRLRRLYKLS